MVMPCSPGQSHMTCSTAMLMHMPSLGGMSAGQLHCCLMQAQEQPQTFQQQQQPQQQQPQQPFWFHPQGQYPQSQFMPGLDPAYMQQLYMSQYGMSSAAVLPPHLFPNGNALSHGLGKVMSSVLPHINVNVVHLYAEQLQSHKLCMLDDPVFFIL